MKRTHDNTPAGRALEVIERMERKVGGHGYTYADVHELMRGTSTTVEMAWHEVAGDIPGFGDADRARVLQTLAVRASLWTGGIRGVDVRTPDPAPAPAPADDPFVGLPVA